MSKHKKKYRILLVDDDNSIRWVLSKALEKAGYEVASVDSCLAAKNRLNQKKFSAVITDIRMPNESGIDLLEYINHQFPQVPVIVMTAHSDLDSAVQAYEKGAFDYLAKPFDLNDMQDLLARAIKHQKNSNRIPNKRNNMSGIIGQAPAMQEVFRAVGRLSKSNITILINGASGTGKELVAKALHQHSKRSKRAFVALNMAAIPKELVESELFGHEKGAFTGAISKYPGKFRQAHGGTLFLDEIGDMPMDIQTRLLRVLAEGTFYSVGSSEPVQADVRVIAATHKDLIQLVEKGLFREDLYHRLNVVRIRLPDLKERKEDIPLLAKHFMQVAAEELEVDEKVLLAETIEHLCMLSWPGNVRQLENTCRWLTVMASGREVHKSDLPKELMIEKSMLAKHENDWQTSVKIESLNNLSDKKHSYLQDLQVEFEKLIIDIALTFTGGRKKDAAELLGWGRNTLTRKLKKVSNSFPNENL